MRYLHQLVYGSPMPATATPRAQEATMTTTTTATYVRSHSHATDEIVAYLVRRTDWSAGHPCTRALIAQVNGATNYAQALDLVRQVRAQVGAQQYGVIDTLYACGCDSGAV